MNNKTAYLVAGRTFEIKDSEMPVFGPDDLLIEIKHVGICGSDLHFYRDLTENGKSNFNYPVVLGHECAGVVAGVGKKVYGFNIGDRVAVEPGVPCMKCEYCMNGRYNLCINMNFMACPPWELAAFHKYISHPAMMCVKLPENMSTLEGALVEPLAVGMHAAIRGGVKPGLTILILGSGCIGLTTLLCCKALGAGTVYIADVFDKRLNKAKELGAKDTINSNKTELVAKIMELSGNIGVDIVFEAAGNPVTAELTQKVVKRGGKIVIVGNVHSDVSFNLLKIGTREIDIVGIFRYCNNYPMLVNAISSGIIDVKPICTDIYPFDKIQTGFDDADKRKMEVVKAVIEF